MIKLERWAEAVRDYEVLRRELPRDNEVVESLQRAQVALKKSHGEDVHHSMKFGGEVEEISSLDKFKAAVCSLGKFLLPFFRNRVIYQSSSILQSIFTFVPN